MGKESLENVQRWTAKRRAALVLQAVKGETRAGEAARRHGLAVAEVERRVEQGMAGLENQLRSRPRDEEAMKDEQIKRLKQKIGELVLDDDILREAAKPHRPPEGLRRGQAGVRLEVPSLLRGESVLPGTRNVR